MTKTIIKAALGLFTAVLASNTVVAQQTQEVTVQASRVVQKQVGRSSAGIPIVDASLSYGVSYADLDLTSHAGVMELQKRVNDAAQKACKELSRQYPIPAQDDAQCAKTAGDKAMVRVNEVVAAAQPSGK